MPDCPHGAHVDHENRIKACESGLLSVQNKLEETQKMIKNPTVTVALISVAGVIFSGTMAFLGVVFGPILKAYLGL